VEAPGTETEGFPEDLSVHEGGQAGADADSVPLPVTRGRERGTECATQTLGPGMPWLGWASDLAREWPEHWRRLQQQPLLLGSGAGARQSRSERPCWESFATW
jgi:hypothetical protein